MKLEKEREIRLFIFYHFTDVNNSKSLMKSNIPAFYPSIDIFQQ